MRRRQRGAGRAAVVPPPWRARHHAEVQSKPNRERRRRRTFERQAGVGHHLLEGSGHRDDPGDDREMQERVAVADAVDAGRRLDLLLQPPAEPAEVAPPQDAHQRHAGSLGEEGGQGRLHVGRGDPDGDQRLPEGDDHEQGVALGEVRHVDVPLHPPGEDTGAQVEEYGQTPQPDPGVGASHRPHDQGGHRGKRRRPEQCHRAAHLPVVAAHPPIQPHPDEPHHQVRDEEEPGVCRRTPRPRPAP